MAARVAGTRRRRRTVPWAPWDSAKAAANELVSEAPTPPSLLFFCHCVGEVFEQYNGTNDGFSSLRCLLWSKRACKAAFWSSEFVQ
ncbi:hypothetical protein BHE74_00039935 [Ensete ventricosum]|nr:hypothetical protein BHE74_00039935 [Ensete ventricosum]